MSLQATRWANAFHRIAKRSGRVFAALLKRHAVFRILAQPIKFFDRFGINLLLQETVRETKVSIHIGSAAGNYLLEFLLSLWKLVLLEQFRSSRITLGNRSFVRI